MKIGFMLQYADSAAGWENVEVGFVSRHTDDAPSWENIKNWLYVTAHISEPAAFISYVCLASIFKS